MTYEFRKDNRSDDEYREQIESRTEKENNCTFEWFRQIVAPLSPEVILKETGVGNDGKVIKEKADFFLADFGLEMKNPHPDLLEILKIEDCPNFLNLEVKVSPRAKATIKEHNFKTYEKRYKPDNFRMLILIDTGYSPFPETHSEWFIMKMEDFDIFRTRGAKENRACFGFKETRMLNYTQLSRHFNLHRLFPSNA